MSLRSWLSRLLPGSSQGAKTCDDPPHNFIRDADIDLDHFPCCPKCGSDDIAMIIYGSPMMTTKIHAAFETGRLIPGGCMVRKTAPAWHCHQCHQDFGRLAK